MKTYLKKSFILLGLCFICTYIISFIPSLFFPRASEFFYLYKKLYDPSNFILYLLLIFSILISTFFLTKLFSRFYVRTSIVSYQLSKYLVNNYLILILEFILIALNVIVTYRFGFAARHNIRFGDIGFIGLSFNFINTFLLYFILLDSISNDITKKRSNLKSFVYYFGIFVTLISSRSSMSLFTLMVSYLSNFKFIRNFNLKNNINLIIKKLKLKTNFIFSVFLVLFIVILVPFFGYFNKNIPLEYILADLNFTVGTIFVRLGTHADSLYNLLFGCSQGICEKYDIFLGIGNKFNYFLNNNEYITYTPGRINVLNTFSDIAVLSLNELAGSSPGLIASMFLASEIFLGFAFCMIYFSYIFFALSSFISTSKCNYLSPISLILYYLFYYYSLSSPLDLLLIFTPQLIPPILIIYYVGKNEVKKKYSI